jgi:hypothetical protein
MKDSDEAPPQSDPMLTKMQDLEEIAAKLLVTARKLPPGQDRHNALQEIGRFRARITGLHRADLRPTRGLKAKGK